jgi:hypothetical protein
MNGAARTAAHPSQGTIHANHCASLMQRGFGDVAHGFRCAMASRRLGNLPLSKWPDLQDARSCPAATPRCLVAAIKATTASQVIRRDARPRARVRAKGIGLIRAEPIPMR